MSGNDRAADDRAAEGRSSGTATAARTATAHAAAPYRPDRRVLTGLAWRVALVVVAAVAVALGAPAWLRAPLSIAAAIGTATFLVQRVRRRGLLDAWLLAVGGGTVLLALLGLLLNLLPAGLSRPAWAVGFGAVQLAVLGALALVRPAVRPAAPRAPARSRIAAIAWGAAVTGVLALAIGWSAASFTATHIAPLALESVPGAGVSTVTVTSGTDEGPFRLELVTDDGRTVLAQDLRVGPGAPASVQVEVPSGVRGLVQLVPEAGGAAVRELIVDSSARTDAS